MRFFLLFSILLLTFSSHSQLTKKVVLHVNVLGKKHETTRYYHPIEGTYDVNLSQFFETKVWEKVVENCIYIDPRLLLKDTLNHVVANSLRYYINTNELLYIHWQWDSDTSNERVLDEFKKSSEQLKSNYQNLVNDYFKPFYMKRGEVSNYEYRQFVYWVRDSLFKEKLYYSEEFKDEEVFTLLNATEKSVYYNEEEQIWQTVSKSDRIDNRKYFSFKSGYELNKCFTDQRTLPVLQEFYIQPNERWYKRRELDVTKLIYHYNYLNMDDSIRESDYTRVKKKNSNIREHRGLSRFIDTVDCLVYPDTLGWVRDSPYFFNDPVSNMYFWHPAYNNYPVVGISWHQAKAFCHWKEQQLMAENPHLFNQFEVDLPRAHEYENAIHQGTDYTQQLLIQDNELITDLLIDNSDGKYGAFHELLLSELIARTEPIHSAINRTKNSSVRKYMKRLKRYYPCVLDEECNEQDFLFNFILMRSSQNYLESGLNYLSNNISEWMNEEYLKNYENLFKAYVNYNCFASLDYCEFQRAIDVNLNRKNLEDGKLIMGANWFDERYEMILGVNTKGLHAKKFESPNKSHSTVGFRYVIRLM